MKLSREVLTRYVDEAPCDWCGCPLYVGDPVSVDLDHGTIYCGRACASSDALERKYALPVGAEEEG